MTKPVLIPKVKPLPLKLLCPKIGVSAQLANAMSPDYLNQRSIDPQSCRNAKGWMEQEGPRFMSDPTVAAGFVFASVAIGRS